jgi:hydroxyethylthiazole kinase
MENNLSMLIREAANYWDKMRKLRPLIHHITNYVAMSEQAHITLAIGASPVMAPEVDESPEMCSSADALLLNIGTPSKIQLTSMIKAQNAANNKGIPILLDPVGYGATGFRNYVVDKILKNGQVSVIKGNYGEISAIAGIKGTIKGVDALKDGSPDLSLTIKSLSNKFNTIVVATGREDLITDGKKTMNICGGNQLLTYITGSGCWSGSIIASVLAVSENLFTGTIAGLIALKLASEKVNARKVGSFRVGLFDELFVLKGKDIAERGDMLRWI